MADVPDFAEVADPDAPPAEATTALVALVWPRARASYAGVAGIVAGGDVTYADRQALAVYLGSGSPPTRNRGKRGMLGTNRPTGTGEAGGLWRF